MADGLTSKQEEFVTHIRYMVNRELSHWGRASGKTYVREYLAKKIIEDDENG